jgi:hypothetical protein
MSEPDPRVRRRHDHSKGPSRVPLPAHTPSLISADASSSETERISLECSAPWVVAPRAIPHSVNVVPLGTLVIVAAQARGTTTVCRHLGLDELTDPSRDEGHRE